MAMYYIHVEGPTRQAEYSYDDKLAKFKRTARHIYEDLPTFEVLDVRIEDEQDNYLSQKWLVLIGTPSQISAAIDDEAQVCLSEYDMFNKYLDGPADQTILIGYQSYLPASEELRRFTKYRLLDSARKAILQDIYEMKESDVHTFTPRTIMQI